MKLRCPNGCGGLSHAGFSIEIDAEGCVNVGEVTAVALLVHGFTLLSESESEDAISSDTSHHEADEIDRLNRRELFALLKEKGVSVSLPVTNDALRVLARAAFGPERS